MAPFKVLSRDVCCEHTFACRVGQREGRPARPQARRGRAAGRHRGRLREPRARQATFRAYYAKRTALPTPPRPHVQLQVAQGFQIARLRRAIEVGEMLSLLHAPSATPYNPWRGPACPLFELSWAVCGRREVTGRSRSPGPSTRRAAVGSRNRAAGHRAANMSTSGPAKSSCGTAQHPIAFPRPGLHCPLRGRRSAGSRR